MPGIQIYHNYITTYFRSKDSSLTKKQIPYWMRVKSEELCRTTTEQQVEYCIGNTITCKYIDTHLNISVCTCTLPPDLLCFLLPAY